MMRVVESTAFWLAAFNGVVCSYDLYLAAVAGVRYAAHRTAGYEFANLGHAQDALLRAIVWLWIMRWAESRSDAVAGEAT